MRGWEKIFDEDDKPLKFNDENLLLASRKIVGFNQIVTDFRNKLAADIAKEDAEEEKALEKN